MVYTVTLNPAIDYIVSPAKFSAGEINRYQKAVYGPGGKGANVSLLLSSLGVRNRALGICAGFSGGEIVRLLEERGCETDFVRMPQGHSRINVKVCAPDGEETDLNGDGPDTPPEAVEELLQKLDGLGEGDTLVLAGSIPRSVPGDIYAAMLRRLEGRGVLAVVDATGEALRCVLPCRPFLVKPNSDELGELFGVEIPDVGTAKEYAKLLVREGARNVVVSMGDKGALLVGETGQSLFCRAVRGGHSRINVKVCAPDGEETDLNGDGPDTPPEAVEELLQKLDGLGEGDTLVLAGSIPRSVPGDIYAAMLRRLEGRGVLAVVDATGEALRCVLPCRPFLVKPNSDELGELFGVEIPDVGTAKEYAKLLVREGARNVVVSMGDKGALLVGETGQSLFCRAVRGEAVSTVGAGDSLVAGFLYGYGLHGTLQGALQWGVAAGAATAFSKGIASGDAVKALYPRAGNPSPI